MSTIKISRRQRTAFTLVELLVVISIIAILAAITVPAVSAARNAARKAKCQHNLKEFGTGLIARASSGATLCSGNFNWTTDGAVTEFGWVADLVNNKIPVGNMLCPSNPAQISETYIDLLTADAASVAALSGCVDVFGPEPKQNSAGDKLYNPCYLILDSALPVSEARRAFVQEKIYEKHYNTNYAASWFMCRGAAELNGSGNLELKDGACSSEITSTNTTRGPLKMTQIDAAAISPQFIPLLADANVVSATFLPADMGRISSGTLVARSMSAGPRDASRSVPSFANGTSRTGATGWWAGWAKGTRQDYRAFSPTHGKSCMVLFADGSVRPVKDTNGDGLLNSGFPAGGGFSDNTVELEKEDFAVLYRLEDKAAMEQ